MRYNAHNILGKADITPVDIRQALTTGLEAFEKKNSVIAQPAHAVLKGDLEPLKWDNQMMRVIGIQRGIQDLYRFLDRLASQFLPLTPARPAAAVAKDEATDVMHGAYWSRAIGEAVVVCFAAPAQAECHIDPVKQGGQALLGRYDVDQVLNEFSAHGISGAVFSLNHVQRDAFSRA
jgi:hypothetical protein